MDMSGPSPAAHSRAVPRPPPGRGIYNTRLAHVCTSSADMGRVVVHRIVLDRPNEPGAERTVSITKSVGASRGAPQKVVGQRRATAKRQRHKARQLAGSSVEINHLGA